MTDPVKPRIIIHNSTAPFVEQYIDVAGMRAGVFKAYQGTDEELFVMVARSLVKRSVPFWEVDWEAMNAAYDPATRNAWVIDPDALGAPTGYGENDSV